MLTQADINDICARVDAAFPLATGAPHPGELASWLRDNVPAMKSSEEDSDEASKIRFVIGCAIHRAYDATRTSFPSVRQAAEFSALRVLGIFADATIAIPLDRINVLIFAHIQRKSVSTSFPDLYKQGWDEIHKNVLDSIRKSIRTLGKYLLGLQAPHLTRWLNNELASTSAVITVDFLYAACRCFDRYAELGYGDKIDKSGTPQMRAQSYCKKWHSLVAWKGINEIFAHVWFSANGEGVPFYGTFRKSMAAANAMDLRLVAGMVLRCSDKKCKGTIEADDKCSTCDKLSHVRESVAWMWLRGQRRSAYAGRCTNENCRYLYYNCSGTCPNCGNSRWGKKKIQGSLSNQQVDIQLLLDRGIVASGESSIDINDWRVIPWLDELVTKVISWPEGPKKKLILTYLQTGTLDYRDRESVTQGLKDLWRSDQNVTRVPTPFEFREWCQEFFHVLQNVHGSEPDEAEIDMDYPQDIEFAAEELEPTEEDDDGQ